MSERLNPISMFESQEVPFDMDAMGAMSSAMLGVSRWTENDALNAIYT